MLDARKVGLLGPTWKCPRDTAYGETQAPADSVDIRPIHAKIARPLSATEKLIGSPADNASSHLQTPSRPTRRLDLLDTPVTLRSATTPNSRRRLPNSIPSTEFSQANDEKFREDRTDCLTWFFQKLRLKARASHQKARNPQESSAETEIPELWGLRRRKERRNDRGAFAPLKGPGTTRPFSWSVTLVSSPHSSVVVRPRESSARLFSCLREFRSNCFSRRPQCTLFRVPMEFTSYLVASSNK
jgi:hypothetical protein